MDLQRRGPVRADAAVDRAAAVTFLVAKDEGRAPPDPDAAVDGDLRVGSVAGRPSWDNQRAIRSRRQRARAREVVVSCSSTDRQRDRNRTRDRQAASPSYELSHLEVLLLICRRVR
jgi:hypothetical protein